MKKSVWVIVCIVVLFVAAYLIFGKGVLTSPSTRISTSLNPNICSSFIRGDANGDRRVDVADSSFINNYLDGGRKPNCTDAADVNDDEVIELNDSMYLTGFLLYGGPKPKSPYPVAGTDEACDGIDNDRDGRVDEGCLVVPPVNNTNQTGSLFVKSTPTNASVYLDDIFKGQTSLTISNIKLGQHIVKLTKPGYQVYSKPLVISAGLNTIDAILLPIGNGSMISNGTLIINSIPSGANIYLNNVLKGITSKTFSYTAGTYNLKLTKVNYFDYTKSITLITGDFLTINATLIPLNMTGNSTAGNTTNTSG